MCQTCKTSNANDIKGAIILFMSVKTNETYLLFSPGNPPQKINYVTIARNISFLNYKKFNDYLIGVEILKKGGATVNCDVLTLESLLGDFLTHNMLKNKGIDMAPIYKETITPII